MMRRVLPALAALLPACTTYAGSARRFDPAEFDRSPGWIAVRGVPEVRQKSREDCGAAALAMVLAHWNADATLESVVAECPPAAGRGIRAGALRDCAKRRGFSSYVLEGSLEDLRFELTRRRPVIVGLVKPHIDGMWSHYEVVVAFHPERRLVVTLDPARGWRENTVDGFVREWAAAGRLTLVVLRPRSKSEGGAE